MQVYMSILHSMFHADDDDMNSEQMRKEKVKLFAQLMRQFTSPGRIGTLLDASVAMRAAVIDETLVSVPYTELGISKQVRRWRDTAEKRKTFT